MQVLILIKTYRRVTEWGAAFQIFGKIDFLQIDKNNGKVENYKFVENSKKLITFCNMAIFILYFFFIFF